MAQEIWRKHLETMYDVSDLGRILNRDTGRVMKLTPIGKGYLTWNCCENGLQTKTYVHRAVAIAFIANPEGYETVDHRKSKEITNNCVSNLRWATVSMQNRNQSIRGAVLFKGVCKTANGEKYVAKIKINGKMVHIGTYATPEEASAAYNARHTAEGFDV